MHKKNILIICLLSMALNILFILPYSSEIISKCYNRLFPVEYLSTDISDSLMLNTVLKSTLENKGVKMSVNEYKGLYQDLISFFQPRRGSFIKNNFYTSYALVGASYYAIAINDSSSMGELKDKADEFVDVKNKKLNYDIHRLDQIPIGILYLNLYKYYRNDLYLCVARNIFKELVNMRDNGILKYIPKSDCQYCDALGMYVPFLMEYFAMTNDSLAYKVAEYNMNQYYMYGVNKETGIPVHGYNYKTKVHVGSSNWGRGIGWYLLAAAYCPFFNDEKLNSSLAHLDYTQFLGQPSSFDSSTALMVEIFKQSKDKNRDLDFSFIKSHVTKSGFVDHCSGDTYDLNRYSQTFTESELCNGLLLILASKFKNK